MSDEGLLTVEEAAQYLKLHPRTVSNKAKSGDIPARKVGGHWRFRPEDVREYNEVQPAEMEQPQTQ